MTTTDIKPAMECSHGHIRRKCYICDLEEIVADRDNEIAALKAALIESSNALDRSREAEREMSDRLDAAGAEMATLRQEIAALREQLSPREGR